MKYENVCDEVIDLKLENNYVYVHFFKRAIDIIISSLLLIVAFPLIILIGLLIKIDSKGSIIYKQKRLGHNGKIFNIYKFRTMIPNAEDITEIFNEEQKEEYDNYFKLENDPRITRLGSILRKTSLDELPQIFNIIRGDMSFIGPRPVVEKEINKFGSLKEKYLSIKPGLTGWWACNGRSITSYEDRIKLEMYYIDNISFILDFKCFLKTVLSIIKREGAY